MRPVGASAPTMRVEDMEQKFPIYQVDFYLHPFQGMPLHCEQRIMMMVAYPDHDDALASLWRIMGALALAQGQDVKSHEGSLYRVEDDTWCLHWNSHYTYNRFPTPADAIGSFLEYRNRHNDEVDTPIDDWHVCECDECRRLHRTMILHLRKDICPSCSMVV